MSAPAQISKYTIARILGRGSMGVVYEGFDPDIQRRVAIKTLTPNISDPGLVAEYHSRFRIEAQASARCMHPNIVTILEYGDLDGMPYMVMEFIDGQPLEDILKLNSPVRFNRALKIFSQLLKGLHFAHQSGVVHRDIKPSNVMVTASDTVKITDFGIARLPASSEVTQMGYTVGTPHYMAPEQEASSDVDGRADLFSLTVILLELLAKVPVSSKVPHYTLSPKGIYITPRVDMNRLIPEPFLPVIQKGLALRPEARFETAQHYAAAIKVAVDRLQRLTHPGDTAGVIAQTSTIAQVSAQERKQRLRDMEMMLVNLIGPIGAGLIELYQDESTRLGELAAKVAGEIPSAKDRALFLRAWQSDEDMMQIPKVDTGRVQTSIRQVEPLRTVSHDPDATVIQSPGIAPVQAQVLRSLQLDRGEIRQIEELFAQYVGPMAEFLVQESMANARDFNELVEKLQESIPNPREKTDFRIKARNITR